MSGSGTGLRGLFPLPQPLDWPLLDRAGDAVVVETARILEACQSLRVLDQRRERIGKPRQRSRREQWRHRPRHSGTQPQSQRFGDSDLGLEHLDVIVVAELCELRCKLDRIVVSAEAVDEPMMKG